MKRFQFHLQEVTDPDHPGIVTTGVGSEKTVAQLMRAAADEIDPPKVDPAYEMGREYGSKIMEDFLGNFGKRPKQ